MDSLDLEPICTAIGYTATRKIAAWYGGQSLHVPLTYRADHPLRNLIGEQALLALIKAYAGERFRIPDTQADDRYRRDRLVAEMLVAGASPASIGQFFGMTTRRVETLRVEFEQEGWLAFAEAPRLRARGVPAGGGLPKPDLLIPIPAHRDGTLPA